MELENNNLKLQSTGRSQEIRRLRQQLIQEKSISTHKQPAPTDANGLLAFGLSLIGFSKSRQDVRVELNLRRWRGHFGVGPKAIFKLIIDTRTAQCTRFLRRELVREAILEPCPRRPFPPKLSLPPWLPLRERSTRALFMP